MILLQNLKIRRDIQKLEYAIYEGRIVPSAEQRVILSQKDLINSEIMRLEGQLYGNIIVKSSNQRDDQICQFRDACCSFLDNVPPEVHETFNNVRVQLAETAWFDDAAF